MSVPCLSVLVAAFNEEASIETCVRRIFGVFPEHCEVIIIDGGSDGTMKVAERLCLEFPLLRYVRNENDRGKGHATKVGIAAASAEIMAEIDADLQFLPEEIVRLIEPIREGRADVVLGSRFMKGSVRRPGSTTWLRTFGNCVSSFYVSVLFMHRMTDVLAGMSAWSRQAAETVNLTSDHFSYAVEFPVKALRHGLRVTDVPVTTDARRKGHSAVNVVQDGLVILWDTTRLRFGLL